MTHTFSRTRESGSREWNVEDLWAAARGLPVFTLFVNGFDEVHDPECWLRHLPDLNHPDVAPEVERIHRADLSYPILLGPDWGVMDGFHRLGKSILIREPRIQAIRFTLETLPPPIVDVRFPPGPASVLA